MSMFQLTINLGNEEMQTSKDVGQLLVKLGTRLINQESPANTIKDTNGNTVGEWHIIRPSLP